MGGHQRQVSVRIADSFASAVADVQMETAGCPLKCAAGDDFVLKGADRLHGLPGAFSVVRCRGCGLMRTDPRPTPQSMAFFYPTDYGPHQTGMVNTSSQPASLPRRLLRAVGKLIQYNATRVPPVTPRRMLEVGAATGAFMKLMAQAGWEVEGIEISETAAAKAREQGLRVSTGSLEDALPASASYDLIVGWMVLEHLHQPKLALEKLRRALTPDGWLVISVPNSASLEFKLFKENWYALDLPRHLFHFTPATLRKLLAASGWEVRRVLHQRLLGNLAGSIGYGLRERNMAATLARHLIEFPDKAGRRNQLLYPLALLFGAFGQTGRMTIWAQPTNSSRD